MNNYKNPILVYNPSAGGGNAKKKINNNIEIIRNNLFKDLTIYESESKENLINKIKEIHKKKLHDLIICLGGDGTISLLANAEINFKKKDRIPIMPIPSGSGDSLVRDFNIYKIQDAINNYKKDNSVKYFDLIYFKELNGKFDYYCINILGMGFVSVIAECAIKYGKKWGTASYFIGALKGLREYKPYKVKIICDKNKTYEFNKVYFLTISNTKYTGGAVKIAPDAEYNDGIMDIIIFHDISRYKFITGYLGTFKSKHVNSEGCIYIKAKQADIYAEPDFSLMPDGELMGKSPIRVKVIKKEIPLIV